MNGYVHSKRYIPYLNNCVHPWPIFDHSIDNNHQDSLQFHGFHKLTAWCTDSHDGHNHARIDTD